MSTRPRRRFDESCERPIVICKSLRAGRQNLRRARPTQARTHTLSLLHSLSPLLPPSAAPPRVRSLPSYRQPDFDRHLLSFLFATLARPIRNRQTWFARRSFSPLSLHAAMSALPLQAECQPPAALQPSQRSLNLASFSRPSSCSVQFCSCDREFAQLAGAELTLRLAGVESHRRAQWLKRRWVASSLCGQCK